MTPTLNGRIQTRWMSLLLVGLPWTILVGPVLLLFAPSGADLGDVYEVAFAALLIVGVVGTVWELIYHGLMQFRWEKDWPALLGLLNGINEFLTTLLFLHLFDYELSFAVFVHFTTTWLLIWVALNGPFRVLTPRWRYRGGRFI